MMAYPTVLLGFETHHPRGLTEKVSHMTTTRLRFVDRSGKIYDLVVKYKVLLAKEKGAFDRSIDTKRLVRSYWQYQEMRYRHLAERTLQRILLRTQSRLLSVREGSEAHYLDLRVATSFSEGYQFVTRIHEIREYANALTTAHHFWAQEYNSESDKLPGTSTS